MFPLSQFSTQTAVYCVCVWGTMSTADVMCVMCFSHEKSIETLIGGKKW